MRRDRENEERNPQAKRSMMPNPEDPYTAEGAVQKFLSFADNIDAKNYQIHIEKYGELDLHDLETRTRAILFNQLDPIIKKQNLETEDIKRVESKLELCLQKVDQLNDVIYERTESGSLALFDRIFAEIKRVE